jgi:S1-C subfamily serine protease
MEKFSKALIAFVVLAISLVSAAPKEGEIIKVIQNTTPEFTTEYTSNFYRETKQIKDLLEPVVKIDFVVEFNGAEIVAATGTGFGIKYDREHDVSYVVTNAHICNIAANSGIPLPHRFYFEDRDTVMNPHLNEFSGDLFPVVMDIQKDLCLMITNKYIRPASLANYGDVHQMDPVKIIGAPNGVYPIIIDSYVSNLISRNIMGPQIKEGRPLLFLSGLIFGGQSGSPIYNTAGKVIGVMFMNLNNEQGPIYGAAAIPIDDVKDFLAEHL